MRCGLLLGAALLAAVSPALASAEPNGSLNTLADVRRALRACWQWPPASEAHSGMELTVRLSFKRNGDVLSVRITYQSEHVSAAERALYHGALLAALSRCSPLPFSAGLGAAIAGRPITFHIHDTRQQRKA